MSLNFGTEAWPVYQSDIIELVDTWVKAFNELPINLKEREKVIDQGMGILAYSSIILYIDNKINEIELLKQIHGTLEYAKYGHSMIKGKL